MTDHLKELANQYLEQAQEEEASKRQYILDKSNAILADLLQDYSVHGELTKFEITPLEMSSKELRERYLRYMGENQ